MRIRLRLANLLDAYPVGKRPVSEVARDIGISRHQLLHLLDKDAKQIKLSALEHVCQYLIAQGRIGKADLPHALFIIEPDRFWSMARSLKHVLLTIGAKSDTHKNDDLVIAADALLHSALVNRITRHASDGASTPDEPRTESPPTIDTRLVAGWTPGMQYCAEVVRESGAIMQEFRRNVNDRALVCLGTVKSNPVSESVVASLFPRAAEFQADEVDQASDRSCPFAIIYRQKDVHPNSCWAAAYLHRNDRTGQPGIHYEDAQGNWKLLPWSQTSDAALVVYHYDKVRRSLLMMLGGFTAQGTRCLAEMLKSDWAERFWPPIVQTETVDVGVFLVRFEARDEPVDVPFHQRTVHDPEVIRLPEDAIRRRFEPAAATGSEPRLFS